MSARIFAIGIFLFMTTASLFTLAEAPDASMEEKLKEKDAMIEKLQKQINRKPDANAPREVYLDAPEPNEGEDTHQAPSDQPAPGAKFIEVGD